MEGIGVVGGDGSDTDGEELQGSDLRFDAGTDRLGEDRPDRPLG